MFVELLKVNCAKNVLCLIIQLNLHRSVICVGYFNSILVETFSLIVKWKFLNVIKFI